MNYLMGHLLGDILLQNKWLARKKIETYYGIILHSGIVSCSIWLFTKWNFSQILLVFVTHFLIDKFSIGKKIYPDLIGQGNPYTNEKAPEWLRLLDDQILHLLCYWLISLIK